MTSELNKQILIGAMRHTDEVPVPLEEDGARKHCHTTTTWPPEEWGLGEDGATTPGDSTAATTAGVEGDSATSSGEKGSTLQHQGERPKQAGQAFEGRKLAGSVGHLPGPPTQLGVGGSCHNREVTSDLNKQVLISAMRFTD